jgi:peptidoglycan/LPS O-acetylase OafA/YrhL
VPRPVDRTQTYSPGLDGLRALSVLMVVGYHLKVPFIGGGFLGVGMFFTLSGFLITRLLCREHASAGRISLRGFWLRRARRLLPAVFLLLFVVVVATAIAQPDQLGTRSGEAAAAMIYMSNWATIRNGVSYFSRFGGLGPLDHLWSLAIEEQFFHLAGVVCRCDARIWSPSPCSRSVGCLSGGNVVRSSVLVERGRCR